MSSFWDSYKPEPGFEQVRDIFIRRFQRGYLVAKNPQVKETYKKLIKHLKSLRRKGEKKDTH